MNKHGLNNKTCKHREEMLKSLNLPSEDIILEDYQMGHAFGIGVGDGVVSITDHRGVVRLIDSDKFVEQMIKVVNKIVERQK